MVVSKRTTDCYHDRNDRDSVLSLFNNTTKSRGQASYIRIKRAYVTGKIITNRGQRISKVRKS